MSRAPDGAVLMVAYYYPPCLHYPTAAARAAGFAKWLPSRGWRPLVVAPEVSPTMCACSACGAPRERPRDEDVHRVRLTPSPLYRAWRRAHARSTSATGPTRMLWRAARSPLTAARLLREIDADWVRAAVAECTRLVQEHPVRAVWTTAGPYASIAIGYHLHRRLGLPWIADVRDAIALVTGDTRRSAVLKRWQRRPYRAMLRAADRVVEVTPRFKTLDDRWLGRPCVLIPSGYDPDEWPTRVASAATNEAFTIVVTGAFYRNRGPERFLEGLRRFVDRLPPGERPRVELAYYGYQGDLLRESAERAGVAAAVRDHGFVAPAIVRERVAASDVVLLVTGDAGWAGGKLWEYLAARRPVLLVPDADDLARATIIAAGIGVVASAPDEIAGCLQTLHDEWKKSGRIEPRGDARMIAAASMAERAAALGRLLDEISDRGSHG